MRLITLPIVDSTNNYAQLLLEQGHAAEKTVILALEQSAGRGQRGSNWESQAGMGLYVSVVLEPKNIASADQILMNKAIACGVAAYISEKCDRKVSIKWPNDIVIEDKKVAGILIENNLRGNQIASVVAGVGVNLNQNEFRGNYNFLPTSLLMLTNKTYKSEQEVENLFGNIWEYYQLFMQKSHALINSKYKELLYRLDVLSQFQDSNGVFEGTLIDVDQSGAILILRDGEVIRAVHPNVRFYSKT